MDPDPRPDAPARRARRILGAVGALALAFLIGSLWQYREARGFRSERDALERELFVQEMVTTVAGAVILADRGGYEGARARMSEFFTALQGRLERMPEEGRGALQEVLAERDQTITRLSRGDPESGQALTRLLLRYQTATGEAPLVVPAGAGDPASAGAGATSPPPVPSGAPGAGRPD